MTWHERAAAWPGRRPERAGVAGVGRANPGTGGLAAFPARLGVPGDSHLLAHLASPTRGWGSAGLTDETPSRGTQRE